MSAQTPQDKRFTTRSFLEQKEAKKRHVMCTAYDATQARMVTAAGVDSILVGDSRGMTTLGYDSTVPVTMDDMIRATAAVRRGAPSSYLIADMPFMSYQHSHTEGMQNAAALVAGAGANAVKLEGASFETQSLIVGLVQAGIPVIGHLGLTPQSINALGHYHTQAKEPDDIVRLMMNAHELMAAGVSAIVVECVPAEVARELREMHTIPIIGIGSGVYCDGEVQVFHDLLGLCGAFKPRHAKRYIEGEKLLTTALESYVSEVRAENFPTEDQTVHIDPKLVHRATPVFVEHLIECVEVAGGEVEITKEDLGVDVDINIQPGYRVDSDGGSSFPGGSNARFN
jgi:3-methyl-2-oxobutanoate hydroxymethyltransferase